jgi:hypothetical protein
LPSNKSINYAPSAPDGRNGRRLLKRYMLERTMHRIVGTLFIVLLAGCETDVLNPSMIEALFATDRFDGKRIVIYGYLVDRREDRSIYISKEFAENSSNEHAAWVNFAEMVTIAGNPIPFNRESIPKCVFDNVVAIRGVLELHTDRYFGSRPATMNEVDLINTYSECGKGENE